jgi:hypothetical protein
MVESNSVPRSPLKEVAQKRKTQEEQRLREEKARQMLPDLKTQIAKLITNRVPAPEIVIQERVSTSLINTSIPNSRDRDHNTRLTANIPLDDETLTKVSITASGYPNIQDPESVQGLSYSIDLNELKEILIINRGEATIQSKTRRLPPLTQLTRVGEPIPSRPKWSRPATPEDIQGYQDMLTNLDQENVIFQGSTPPIIKSTPKR